MLRKDIKNNLGDLRGKWALSSPLRSTRRRHWRTSPKSTNQTPNPPTHRQQYQINLAQRSTTQAHRNSEQGVTDLHQPRPYTADLRINGEPKSDFKTDQLKIQQMTASNNEIFNKISGSSALSPTKEDEWTKVQRKQKKQNIFTGKFDNPNLLQKMNALREQGKCFKCAERGHLQANCRNLMKCFKCNGVGHKSSWCKAKAIKTNTVPPTVPKPFHNREQTKNHHKEREAIMENWQTMPMLSPDSLPMVRHEIRRVYVPSREGFHPSNELLDRAAVVHMGPHCNERTLAHRLANTLAAQLHSHPRDFMIGKLDPSTGHFLVAFPTVDLRNHAVNVGVFAIDHNSRVQLATWQPSLGMVYDPPTYKARLKLVGVPMNAWNEDDLDHLLAGLGHVIKLAPVFENGNFETVRVLITCHNPASIPPSLLMSTNPYFKTVKVGLEGWSHSPVGRPPSPGGGGGRLHHCNNRRVPSPQRRSPDSDDYSRSLTDTYHNEADSAYSRRTRPVLPQSVQAKPVQGKLMHELGQGSELETTVISEIEKNKGKDNIEVQSLVPREGKRVTRGPKILATVIFKKAWGSVSIHAQCGHRGTTTHVRNIMLEIPLPNIFSKASFYSTAQEGHINIGPTELGSVLKKQSSTLTITPIETELIGNNDDTFTQLAQPIMTLPGAGPFAFLFDDGPPPGFRNEIALKKEVRRSPRIKEKETGPYISSEEKACKLKGEDFVSFSPKRIKRKSTTASSEDKLDYMRTYDPLSGTQAEIVVNAAGIEFEEDLHFKVGKMVEEEGTVMGLFPATA